MKRKERDQRGVEFFFKRIGSTSSANITAESIAENAKSSEEQQSLVVDNSNLVDMQTADQNIVEPAETSEQVRLGSTSYERDLGKRQ